MNMVCSLYLDLLKFLSMMFYNFLCRGLTHFFLDLFLDISYFFTVLYSISFKIFIF